MDWNQRYQELFHEDRFRWINSEQRRFIKYVKLETIICLKKDYEVLLPSKGISRVKYLHYYLLEFTFSYKGGYFTLTYEFGFNDYNKQSYGLFLVSQNGIHEYHPFKSFVFPFLSKLISMYQKEICELKSPRSYKGIFFYSKFFFYKLFKKRINRRVNKNNKKHPTIFKSTVITASFFEKK